MGRPHTEFVQSQAIPWEPEGDAEAKILSQDSASGAVSRLLRVPPGWCHECASPDVMEEFLVLDGVLRTGEHRLPRYGYGTVPAGEIRPLVAERGATILHFINPGIGGEAHAIDTSAMAWGSAINDSNLRFMGLGRKLLRDDPEREERVMLLSMAPQAYPAGGAAPPISHPCAEEMYLLGGDVVSEYGTMRSGAYFWRPANIPHGPHGSHTGAFMLIRFMDGRHENHWSDEPRTFDPEPPYRPVLPPEMSGAVDLRDS